MNIDSWFLSKKYFDPQTPANVAPDTKSASGYWKGEEPPEEVVADNDEWADIELGKGSENRFAISPRGWERWYRSARYFSPPIAVEYLMYAGIIPEPEKQGIPRLSSKMYKKLAMFWLTIIPDQRCIKKQIDYIYERPERFLVIVNYGHDEAEMLASGRNIASGHDLPLTDKIKARIGQRYLLSARIPKNVLDKYSNLSNLQRYGLLNSVIRNAPYCHRPLILFRGSKGDTFNLGTKRQGFQFVSNSILSTSVNMRTVKLFVGRPCCLYVFYLARDVPRLFMNRYESEFLLPAGLLMEYASTDTIKRTVCHRIKVLKVAESREDL
jgi:hypothetical protein